MTVAELIEELKKFNPQHQVWLSRDEEGNGYNPVSEASNFTTFELERFEDGEEEISISLEQFTYRDVAEHPNVVMIWPGWYKS